VYKNGKKILPKYYRITPYIFNTFRRPFLFPAVVFQLQRDTKRYKRLHSRRAYFRFFDIFGWKMLETDAFMSGVYHKIIIMKY